MPITKNGFYFDDNDLNLGVLHITSKIGKRKYKVRIKHDKQSYMHDLNHQGKTETFPLQMGNGIYTITVYEQTSGSKYRLLFNLSYNINCEDEWIVYLQSNKYSSYTNNSAAVIQANKLTENITKEKQKADIILQYIERNFLYDYMKAFTMPKKGTYIPDLEETMETKHGICFDLASLVCCMLRSQGIPTKMVMGYADGKYHAWNRVYINEQWLLVDITNKITNLNVRRYSPELYY